MRALLVCLFLCMGSIAIAQSKKELIAEVNTLKAEVEQLKKPKEIELNDKHKKASYGLGILLASNIKTQGADSLNAEAIAAGINDVFLSKETKLKEEEAGMIVQTYMMEVIERKTARMKDEGQKFLEENKKKPGVKVTESGMQYEVISAGTGKTPGPDDNVTVHYTGKLIDGTVFDSSVERNEPATFGVSDVIPGWTEALQLMKEGDKWIVYLPYDLAYGERGAGQDIPPYATLVFEVELIKVN
ncbi:MAG TPA: FKBP-type peptidyl-prolyl cis-trans isomerase [Cyclobacteriaceae bacterium]|nr:FKBP-type peptidyl-prolyl cis-trans isomerase [Cyclobacteriaceae bacterium]